MLVLLRESIRWINLPFTIIIVTSFVYWITVILGTLDMELFDFDLELDGFWGFLNIGSFPFSIWISICGLLLWINSIVINLLLDAIPFLSAIPDGIRLVPLYAVNISLSFFITKILTNPLKKLFKEKVSEKKDFIGKDCIITSTKVDIAFGTAELIINGVPQIIDVVNETEKEISKDDKVLIIDYYKDKDVFLIEKL